MYVPCVPGVPLLSLAYGRIFSSLMKSKFLDSCFFDVSLACVYFGEKVEHPQNIGNAGTLLLKSFVPSILVCSLSVPMFHLFRLFPLCPFVFITFHLLCFL